MTNNIITIDGLASSGKTSAGVRLAQELGYKFVDSGSIYRAGCLSLLRSGSSMRDDQASQIFDSMDLAFSTENGEYKVFLSGEDVTEFLGSPQITEIVPVVGSGELVRLSVKSRQLAFAKGKNLVVTGRDVGSEIFPDAQIKYYLTANPEIRALRRFIQSQSIGGVETYEGILEEIKRRDHLDSTREISPSRIPVDASVIDTSSLSLNEVVRALFGMAVERLGELRSDEGRNFRSREML